MQDEPEIMEINDSHYKQNDIVQPWPEQDGLSDASSQDNQSMVEKLKARFLSKNKPEQTEAA